MRLINVQTLGLEEFLGDVPEYAILSHTWGPEEVSLQDMALLESDELTQPNYGVEASPYKNYFVGQQLVTIQGRSGYKKIEMCCAQANRDGYRYVWVDTCCIDKTSSAELSEAINSMFHWYQSSAVCYAFLSDVDTSIARSQNEKDPAIQKSRWFTRGWTLQEFLAPREVVFYDACWKLIGLKKDLVSLLASITGISPQFIDGTEVIGKASIAQRMSWASSRQTTRIEDLAYCLLGIFDVNIPLLYGERHKAFLRLQEEIVRRTEDHSYLAWAYQTPLDRDCHGIFAKSPAEFAGCGDVIHDDKLCSIGVVQLTNKGLQLPLTVLSRDTDFLAVLRCCRMGDRIIGFPIDNDKKLENGTDVWRVPGGLPVRHRDPWKWEPDGWKETRFTGFLKNSPSARFWKSQSRQLPIEFRGFHTEKHPSLLILAEVWPPYVWIPSRAPNPLSARGEWRTDRVLMNVVLRGVPRTVGSLVLALDIEGSLMEGQDSEFRVFSIRPKVIRGNDIVTFNQPYESLAEMRFWGIGRSVARELLDSYTNAAELHGNLISVMVREEASWIVDVNIEPKRDYQVTIESR